jgi:hypothetical protein
MRNKIIGSFTVEVDIRVMQHFCLVKRLFLPLASQQDNQAPSGFIHTNDLRRVLGSVLLRYGNRTEHCDS